MMSVLLKRGTGTVQVSVENPSGFGDQGEPTFGSATTISAQVERSDRLARNPDGSETIATLTVWIDSEEDLLPIREARLTLDPDGTPEPFVVLEVHRVTDFRDVLDHVECLARDA